MIDKSQTLEELIQKNNDKFTNYYGRTPRWVVVAPGRVNIIGEHTDYNKGFVFPMGIERYTVLAADLAPATTDTLRVRCMRFNETAKIKLHPITKGEPSWSNYIRGVILGYQKRGIEVPSLDVAMLSNIPLGGGLSSSAALEIATGTLIEAVTGKNVPPKDKALIAQKAEHDFANIPCGIMDQFISAMARKNKIMLLDCRSYETKWTTVHDQSVAFLIINSNVKHQLASGEYAKRRSECEAAAKAIGVEYLRDATLEQLEACKNKMGDIPYRRAYHVIMEDERTLKAANALEHSQFEQVGQYMFESHQSLMTNFEVSCLELDCIVKTAKNIGLAGGVYGCRMTGGGFGGCAIALVKEKALPRICEIIEQTYKKETGISCTLFSTHPADGTHEVKMK